MNHASVEEQVAGLHRGYWIGAAVVVLGIGVAYEVRSSRCPYSCTRGATTERVAVAPPSTIRHRGVIPDSFRRLVRSTFSAEVAGGRDGILRVQSTACNQAAAERVIAAARRTDLVEGGFVEFVCERSTFAPGGLPPARVELLGEAGRKRMDAARAIERMAHTRGILIDEAGISDAGEDGTTLFVVSDQCASLNSGKEVVREVMSLIRMATPGEWGGFTSIRCEGGATTGPVYLTLTPQTIPLGPR